MGKLGGAFETEDNNQAWLSPMKYPMSSGWRNTKTKVEFVLPASKAIMFLYFRLGQIGHTDDSAYGYACRYHYGTFEIVSVAGTIKRTVASTARWRRWSRAQATCTPRAPSGCGRTPRCGSA